MRSILSARGWETVHHALLPGRDPEYRQVADLNLSRPTEAYLAKMPNGIYGHQHRALQAFLAGDNVCLTTGTASGKTLAFMASAIEILSRNPRARVLAIYPLKALAKEQELRWRRALQDAGMHGDVGRIDGSVHTTERESKLRSCRVILATPDVLHAWLLGNLSARAVRIFLSALELVIVDEVHVYTGVFGSNSAYLFRRLRHAVDVLSDHRPLRFVGASATIAEPATHLQKLFGVNFDIIGEEADTSPRHEREVLMVRPPGQRDLYTEIPELLSAIVEETDMRFLAFVDSRRQTEQLATILSRRGAIDGDVAATGEPALDLNILPYRAGFEESDRALIQERLTSGSLRGVISTSALELGLDIPDLDAAILIGVPQTGTSLQQRIGRVGRHKRGYVLIIDAGGITDGAVFRDPTSLFERPLAPTALYLNNQRIQYIHALCFASAGGEYDALRGTTAEGAPDPEIITRVDWPDGFKELCAAERAGGVAPELQSLKADAGDDPWHAFPLRDVGSQYRVEGAGNDLERLGSLSHSQLMREAYPGAVYYYMTTPYRVTRVMTREKKVVVKRERHYTTTPSGPPVHVFPQLQDAQRAVALGDLRLVECGVYISEVLTGYTERRGPNEIPVKYPNSYWQRERFTRNYATTGVVLAHPALMMTGVDADQLAALILEAFLLVAPFERTDVSAGAGRFPTSLLGFAKGDRYLALYDQTYGSLRLSGHLMKLSTLKDVLRETLAIADSGRAEGIVLSEASLAALRDMGSCAERPPVDLKIRGAQEGRADTAAGESPGETVIMPGSFGWIITDDNQEFAVERVFLHPQSGLVYRGHRAGTTPSPDVQITFPVANVRPVPGQSKLGRYCYDSGEVVPLEE